jgi:hypothetical protein
MVKESPKQMVPLFTTTVGVVNTVRLDTAGSETQAIASDPVTVYEVFEEGETVLDPEEYV